jgi:hypothetical protein
MEPQINEILISREVENEVSKTPINGISISAAKRTTPKKKTPHRSATCLHLICTISLLNMAYFDE